MMTTNYQLPTTNSETGFSLVELLVVIGIMAILGAVSWPIVKSLQPSLRLSAVTRDLTVNLRFAQQKAVTEQVKYGLRFSLDSNSYQVLKFSTTTQVIGERTLPTGVWLYEINGFTNKEVIFNVLGAAKTAGTVVLKNNQQQSATIEVHPSGFIKIQ